MLGPEIWFTVSLACSIIKLPLNVKSSLLSMNRDWEQSMSIYFAYLKTNKHNFHNIK